ncbi:hypothetical protein PL11201_140002 [Planktothrix sp. PCC 11201]|nr:hypothetical protein PL11201_140002 [Planktothrix sp. PCC 11201]
MILGAGWDEFLSILALFGGIAPNPSATNQNCSNFGNCILNQDSRPLASLSCLRF